MSTAVLKQAYYEAGGIPQELARRYFRLLGDVRTVLDLGCGTGDLGRYAGPGIHVVGVDVDAHAVDLAAQHEESVQLDLDAGPLPFEDAAFDAVVAKDVFEHVRDPGRLADEVRRVTAPAGPVLASVIMAKPRAVWSDYTHVRGFTRSAASMLLEDAGLTVDAVWRMGPVPLSNRLRFMDAVPTILRLPGPSQLWATSWELLARAPG